MTSLTPARRDFLAGLLILLFGLFFAYFGSDYSIGSLQQMGSGFFPVALGSLLGLIGIAISATAYLGGAKDGEESILPAKPDWRGWGCIIGGVLLFIILGNYAGLVPAIFGCVFLAALGDRDSTVIGSFVLALVLAVVGTFVFVYLLQIPFPALRF